MLLTGWPTAPAAAAPPTPATAITTLLLLQLRTVGIANTPINASRHIRQYGAAIRHPVVLLRPLAVRLLLRPLALLLEAGLLLALPRDLLGGGGRFPRGPATLMRGAPFSPGRTFTLVWMLLLLLGDASLSGLPHACSSRRSVSVSPSQRRTPAAATSPT